MMRKALAALLLASTITGPAIAQAQSWQGRDSGRGDARAGNRADAPGRPTPGRAMENRGGGDSRWNAGASNGGWSGNRGWSGTGRADQPGANRPVQARPGPNRAGQARPVPAAPPVATPPSSRPPTSGMGAMQRPDRNRPIADDRDRGGWTGDRGGNGRWADRDDGRRPGADNRWGGDPRNDNRWDNRWDNGRNDWRWTGNRGDDRWNGGGNWNGRDRDRWDNRPGADNRRWDRDWRRDNRYDWQRYRSANRYIYRAPLYSPPRGYGQGYRRWAYGYRLPDYYFVQNYWIDDPWQYRLPPAYGPYRWVRYYNDVLLVDITSGLIQDIIYSFFWR